jgi:phosphatidylserine/phosphatidylglycerophosphate/cardiolipin synthase-like enzyme
MTSKVETLTTVNTYPFLEDGHPSDQAVAFVDRDTKAGGSHHQKILMVCGSRGIVGFFGGLDVFDDRVRPTTAIGPFSLVGGSPLFDTHCMVVGDAAADLYKIAKDRFSTCQSSAYPTRSFNEVNLSPVYANATVQFAATPSKVEKAARKHLVRFATTDGRFNGTTKDVWSQLQYAIDRAEQYVYGQDQYFWSLAAAERLNAAAKRGVAVVLLSPADAIAAPGAPGLRRNFVSKLLDGLSPEQANRVCICCRKDMGIALSGTNFDGPGNYVHSKLWIFDDALSIVGSANCNDRGYSHDSEVIGAFTDTESAFDVETNWTAPKTTTARGLRIRLWQQHLCLPRKHVYDAISAILYWRYPRRSGRIENLYGPFLLRAQDPVLDKPIPASDLE